MQSAESLLALVSGQVGDLAHSDVVIGEPIELGAVTIVPLSRVSIGFGGGGAAGEGEAPQKKGKRPGSGRGSGGGGGGGGKVRPVAVIVFGPDGVSVEPIPDKKGLLDKLFDKVPDLVSKLKDVIDGTPEPAATGGG